MGSKKNAAKQTILSLEDEKEGEFSLREVFKKTTKNPVFQGYDAPCVMKDNEPQSQQSSVPYSDKQAGLHASDLRLASAIGGSLSPVQSQMFSIASYLLGNEIRDHGESSSDYSLDSDPREPPFQEQLQSKATNQYLVMKSFQAVPEERVSDGDETGSFESFGHQGRIDVESIPNGGHNYFSSYQHDQFLDSNSWIISSLEASRQLFGGLSLNQKRGAITPSDKQLDLSNHFCRESETANIISFANQELGNQATTQDYQGFFENYGNGSCLQNGIGKIHKSHRFNHSAEPYTKMSKKARELLKKKQIQEQLDFVERFHGICPKLIYSSSYTEEDENQTPPSPTWPGK